MAHKILLLILLLFSQQAFALNVMAINVEWFWDENTPHEGRIVGIGDDKIPPPTKKEVDLEAFAIAQLILKHNVDIVGLVEVENHAVVKRIKQYLPRQWKVVFDKGRDSMTGQDVTILTRLTVNEQSITDSSPKQSYGSATNIRPSKLLAVALTDNNQQQYYVVVTHLISKRRATNDEKRTAQARSIAKLLDNKKSTYTHMIVMGDLNDELGSTTLNTLLSTDLVAISNDHNYSYVYNNRKQLIDHILVTRNLSNNSAFIDFNLGPISDHRGVMAKMR